MAEDPGQRQHRTADRSTRLSVCYFAGLMLPAVLLRLLVSGRSPVSEADGALVVAAWRAVVFSAAAVVLAAGWVRPHVLRLSQRRAYWATFAAGFATLPLLPASLVPLTNVLSALTPGTVPVEGRVRVVVLALLTGVHALLILSTAYAWFGGPAPRRLNSPRLWSAAALAMILLFVAGVPEGVWIVVLGAASAEFHTRSAAEGHASEAVPQPWWVRRVPRN